MAASASSQPQQAGLPETLAGVLPTVAAALCSEREAGKALLEADLQRLLGGTLETADVTLVSPKTPRLEPAWKVGPADLLLDDGSGARCWVELKWVRSAREVRWAVWDLLKLASCIAADETQTARAVFVVGGDAAELAPDAAAPRRERFQWDWLDGDAGQREWDTVDQIVLPTIALWMFCLTENEGTYPRKVPRRVVTRPLAAASTDVASTGFALRAVEVSVPPEGRELVPMPGTAESPLSVSVTTLRGHASAEAGLLSDDAAGIA